MAAVDRATPLTLVCESIVCAYRTEQEPSADQSGTAPLQPLFSHPADLEAVRGIGPKTVEKIAPFLKFPPPAGRAGQD